MVRDTVNNLEKKYYAIPWIEIRKDDTRKIKPDFQLLWNTRKVYKPPPQVIELSQQYDDNGKRKW